MKYGLYNGCHNTFVFCDYEEVKNDDLSKVTIKYCNKHNVDGLIAVRRIDEYNHVEMIFYNRDGSRAPMCGNGIRCLALFAYEHGWVKYNETINVETLSGTRQVLITNTAPFKVLVNLGKPDFSPETLSLDSDKEFIDKELLIKDKLIRMSAIFLATHHCVIKVDDIHELDDYASSIENNPFFKKEVNVNFVKVLDRDNVLVHTYERGVGWTLACGTGGSSSFAIMNLLGYVNDKVCVNFLDGYINLSKGENGDILMEGPAVIDAWIEE